MTDKEEGRPKKVRIKRPGADPPILREVGGPEFLYGMVETGLEDSLKNIGASGISGVNDAAEALISMLEIVADKKSPLREATREEINDLAEAVERVYHSDIKREPFNERVAELQQVFNGLYAAYEPKPKEKGAFLKGLGSLIGKGTEGVSYVWQNHKGLVGTLAAIVLMGVGVRNWISPSGEEVKDGKESRLVKYVGEMAFGEDENKDGKITEDEFKRVKIRYDEGKRSTTLKYGYNGTNIEIVDNENRVLVNPYDSEEPNFGNGMPETIKVSNANGSIVYKKKDISDDQGIGSETKKAFNRFGRHYTDAQKVVRQRQIDKRKSILEKAVVDL